LIKLSCSGQPSVVSGQLKVKVDMADTNVSSVAAIQQAVRDFRDARDWRQFHSPKNLSMSIAIEAAELMEHFQWLTTAEAAALTQNDPAARQAIAEELADVLIYCFSLADVLAFDVAEIILAKLAKNAGKYPVESKT
jgi:NTP pyrophosphatase (non-canonical NTP hydrolase)